MVNYHNTTICPHLLRTNDASRSNNAHKGNGLVGSETVLPNEVRSNESTSTAQSSLAMYSDNTCDQLSIVSLSKSFDVPPLEIIASATLIKVRTISSVGFVPSSK